MINADNIARLAGVAGLSTYITNHWDRRLDADTQERVTLRLRRIEGQIQGLVRMVAGSRLCVDLLTQIAAAQAAMKGVGDEILHYHVGHCVPESFGARRLSASGKARLEEMEKIFVQYCKEPHGEYDNQVPVAPGAVREGKARKRVEGGRQAEVQS